MIAQESFYIMELSADGKWHTITSNLTSLSAFEIIAYSIGLKRMGRYSVLHAIALNAYGKGRIKNTNVSFGWKWLNKLSLRWTGNTQHYELQIRTKSNYGPDTQIKLGVRKLWNDKFVDF